MWARSEFLLRFGGLALISTLAIALVLSRVLASQQAAKAEEQIVFTSLGQVSNALTPFLTTDFSRPLTQPAYRKIQDTVSNVQSYIQYLDGLRLYRPDGAAVYPASAAPDMAEVAAAIRKQDMVRGAMHSTSSGQQVFTAYFPLANPQGNRFAAVVALDFDQTALNAVDARQQQFVFAVTWGACTLIFVSLVALAVAAQRELNRRQRLAEETFTQTMTGIAGIVDKRDPYTAGHSKRVAGYAGKLARRMGMRAQMVRTIESAALLHDIGKIGIPDAVLLKPAKLDERERMVIGLHPVTASEIFAGVEAMREITPCILHHHERWDGRGYPAKIAGGTIPIGARVIAVADTYDAMTTDRPYRRALTPEIAREELLRGAGVQWDSDCVAAFIELIDSGQVPPPPPAENAEALTSAFGQQVPI